jgi:hypothetical protein
MLARMERLGDIGARAGLAADEAGCRGSNVVPPRGNGVGSFWALVALRARGRVGRIGKGLLPWRVLGR